MGLAAIVVTFSVQSYVLAYGDPNNAGLYFVVALNGLVLLVMIVFLMMDLVPMTIRKFLAAIENRKRTKALRIADAARRKSSSVIGSTQSTLAIAPFWTSSWIR